MNGLINLLKPPGMTSSDAVVWLRRRLRGVKLGHAGTLDPEAAGVLPLMLGKATRLFDELVDKDKEYLAEWMPGVATDTQDSQGRVIARSACRPSMEDLKAILPQFTGVIWQRPPVYSAIKLDGSAAYERARRGEDVDIPLRQTRVDAIEALSATDRGGTLLRIRCGRGTYVRTLCHDIGSALGCPAHMAFLLRTRSGRFAIEDAVTLEELEEALENGALETLLAPMDAPLAHLPRADIPAEWDKRARCGNPLPAECLQLESTEGAVRLYLDGALAGIGIREGAMVRFRTMLL
ncbi:MAG TPA: tRNA pseudouridine(55) synthase TruB [Clostridia bacterium]|nr:tRNA pseudouridine(55) synthase TruB [Clostridia bacterium]